MKVTTCLKMLIILLLSSNYALAQTQKHYHVEILIFESKEKEDLQAWPIDPGKPSLNNTISLVQDPEADFGQLSDNSLVLNNAKKRIQKNYHLVLHKGWRQTITDKEHAPKIHLFGGKALSDNNGAAGMHEVDGIVRLSLGRNIYIDTDLLLSKSTLNKMQSFRLIESSKIKPDEITYIDHPLYGIIVMVIPEKQTS
ncbi:MAG: hypothetical protein JSS07_05410 [Proteobacteria bacterium]|nr:hypothetical protein [Pseudomonadota bacterium]